MPPATFAHSSPLGRWTHTEWAPQSLAGVVSTIWDFDGVTTHRRERTFPNGLAELVVHLGDRYREDRGPTGRFEICPAACLTGVQTRPFVIESPRGRSRVLGIRLTALGAYFLLGGPVPALTNTTVDLVDAVGPMARELEDEVSRAADATSRVRKAAAWVASRVARAVRIDPAVAWMVAEIERTRGRARIGELRGQVGYSKARLAAIFREQVGLTPKTYGRVLRFHRALTLLNRPNASLPTVAREAGFYDQPHMNADFRSLGGLAPGDFLGAIRYENSVNLAE